MNQPPMRAYAVTLVFANGLISGSTVVAPAREAAAAMAMQWAMRDNGGLLTDLTGFALTELTAEWMRATLRQIEGQPGQVVSLVSDNPRPPGTKEPRPAMESIEAPLGYRWAQIGLGEQPRLEPDPGESA